MKKHYDRRRIKLQKAFFAGPLPQAPVTIFVHGTKASLISRLVHKLDYSFGIVPATLTQTNSILAKIAKTLHCASPTEFPLDSFYFYGWPGKMNFPARLRAAERLYGVIKHHRNPLTLICHSHGSNVALNLACIADRENDTEFKVDRLILLAPPVQVVTQHLINSPIFKEVYTFYSTADLFQIGDAQALYWESYHCPPPGTRVPFFSKRTYEPEPHVIQTRVLIDSQSPGHLAFMLSQFLCKLPQMLTLLKNASQQGDFEKHHNCFIVNIPLFNQPPHLVDPLELKNNYIPRSSYYRLRKKFKNIPTATLPSACSPLMLSCATPLPR